MRKITLPSGRMVEVALYHTALTDGRRATTAVVAMGTPDAPEGLVCTQATCSKQDAFVRRTGRLLAARRANDALKRLGWDKQDRGAIFTALYAPKPKKKTEEKAEVTA